MVHERRLRERLEDAEDAKNLHTLIHAIVVATLKHVSPDEIDMDSEDVETQVRLSTDIVMLQALNGMVIFASSKLPRQSCLTR